MRNARQMQRSPSDGWFVGYGMKSSAMVGRTTGSHQTGNVGCLAQTCHLAVVEQLAVDLVLGDPNGKG
jgi:hypothetical protein